VLGGDFGQAFALFKEEIDKACPAQLNAEAFQRLATGLEIQAFGIDQDAVVVPENGF
jgi:hypothetical protein